MKVELTEWQRATIINWATQHIEGLKARASVAAAQKDETQLHDFTLRTIAIEDMVQAISTEVA